MSLCQGVAVLPDKGDEKNPFQSSACSMSDNQLFESSNLSFESTTLEHGKVPDSKLLEEAKTDCENVDEKVIIFARCPIIACEGVPAVAR